MMEPVVRTLLSTGSGSPSRLEIVPRKREMTFTCAPASWRAVRTARRAVASTPSAARKATRRLLIVSLTVCSMLKAGDRSTRRRPVGCGVEDGGVVDVSAVAAAEADAAADGDDG